MLPVLFGMLGFALSGHVILEAVARRNDPLTLGDRTIPGLLSTFTVSTLGVIVYAPAWYSGVYLLAVAWAVWNALAVCLFLLIGSWRSTHPCEVDLYAKKRVLLLYRPGLARTLTYSTLLAVAAWQVDRKEFEP